MKLRIYTYLLSVARKLVDELEWRVIYHTPVEENPHKPGTIDYYLCREANRLQATHRLWKP